MSRAWTRGGKDTGLPPAREYAEGHLFEAHARKWRVSVVSSSSGRPLHWWHIAGSAADGESEAPSATRETDPVQQFAGNVPLILSPRSSTGYEAVFYNQQGDPATPSKKFQVWAKNSSPRR